MSVFPIEVMPLRERIEDIPLLAAHFLSQTCRRLGVQEVPLKRRHVLMLRNYDWPGNIRELQNVIERAVITARSGVLQFELSEKKVLTQEANRALIASPQQQVRPENEIGIRTHGDLKTQERENILAALQSARWKISGPGGAANLLGVKPTTVASRMKAMGISRPR